MASQGESKRVGVLAEDASDCDVLKEIIRRVRVKKEPLGVNPFNARGCANLRRKMIPRIKLMLGEGCSAFIIVHDLDSDKRTLQLNDKDALLRELESKTYPAGAEERLICMPVEELEAWFWSDQHVLDTVARGNPATASHHPHKIIDPKGKLSQLYKRNGKSQYSTNANKELAALLDLNLCASRCPEFAELCHFIERL